MPLPTDYPDENCALARSLEVVGARWTLLIIRDAFYGVRRFSDFAEHLRIPRNVLARRLRALVAAGVLRRVDGVGRLHEYELTDAGLELWPGIRSLINWGDDHLSPNGVRRHFHHLDDDGLIGPHGTCATCGSEPPADHLVVTVGPGLAGCPPNDDPISRKLREPHRLLQPIHA